MKFAGKIKWLFAFCILLLLLSPVIMHLIWTLKQEKLMNILIIDKTVTDLQKNEHASFTWLLNNLKVVKKENKTLYTQDDYYGFFPEPNEKFYVSDFEKLDSSKLVTLADKNQAIYITDSYGVYSNEWYQQQQISERSKLIYGGLSNKEINVLKYFKEQGKLIIAEFNCIGSPTEKVIRNNFEDLFHIKWTGWIGRYFDRLSEANADIPHWLINNYKSQHKGSWPFHKSGIAFVNENDQIEILEEGKELMESVPSIYTNKEHAKEFNLPEKINYPYWFDIMQTDNTTIPVSIYHIATTAKGDSIMKKNGILKTFPAVIEHAGADYTFYYFSGDFADNHISKKLAHYSGIVHVKSFFSSLYEDDRENFYWNYYYPLVSKIVADYYIQLNAKNAKK